MGPTATSFTQDVGVWDGDVVRCECFIQIFPKVFNPLHSSHIRDTFDRLLIVLLDLQFERVDLFGKSLENLISRLV